MQLTLKQEISLLIEDWLEQGFRPTRALIRNFYGPSRREVIRSTLYRMEKYGQIDKFEKEGEVVYGLTDKGRETIIGVRFFRMPISRDKWDGIWRLVIFDIPEEKKRLREILRLKLKELGFGKLQRSVWVTPNDLLEKIEWLENRWDLSGYLYKCETENLGVEDEELFAQYTWPMKEINEEYLKFIERSKLKINEFKEKKEKGSKASITQLKMLEVWYQDILYRDPLLPREFLPEDWKAFEARSIFQKLNKLTKTPKICNNYTLRSGFKIKEYK